MLLLGRESLSLCSRRYHLTIGLFVDMRSGQTKPPRSIGSSSVPTWH
jgi:hypothetical protein